MITLCHAADDMEVLFIRALLEHEQIPYFIIGEHFRSLYPGVQIPSYNERRFVVPQGYLNEARTLLGTHRQVYEPIDHQLSKRSKFRMVLEYLMFGWCLPGGTKRDKV